MWVIRVFLLEVFFSRKKDLFRKNLTGYFAQSVCAHNRVIAGGLITFLPPRIFIAVDKGEITGSERLKFCLRSRTQKYW